MTSEAISKKAKIHGEGVIIKPDGREIPIVLSGETDITPEQAKKLGLQVIEENNHDHISWDPSEKRG